MSQIFIVHTNSNSKTD